MSIFENKSQLTPQLQPRFDNIKSVFFNIGKKALDSQNPFKSYQHDENLKLSVSKLSDEQVQASQIYNHLIEKINQLKQKSEQASQEHHQRLNDIDEVIKYKKQAIHYCKFQSWELKNEIMALQEELADQIQENHEIEKWFCAQGEEDQDEENLDQGSQEQLIRNDENDDPTQITEILSSKSMNTLGQISISCSDA